MLAGAGRQRSGADMSGRDRALAMAIGTSIVLHAILLSVHFKFPDALRWKSANAPLEVVLVNAKTKEKPSKADLLAQANLDRGGNVDQNRRAKTPLPVVEPRNPGKDLAEAQRRVQQLEAQQRKLLAQAREARSRVAAEAPKAPVAEQAVAQPNGRDLA